MRSLVLLTLLATSLAGCTLGAPETEPFVATCPTWVEGPGKQGLRVESGYYISNNDGELKEFNLDGVRIAHPPTGKQELNGATLDFFQLELPATNANGTATKFAVDGHFTFKAYRTDPSTPAREQSDENPDGFTAADRGAPLLFRDLSKKSAQYTSIVEIRPSEDETWSDQTYRIELAPDQGPLAPDSLWLEYTFHPDADNDESTPSGGTFEANIYFWYRQPC